MKFLRRDTDFNYFLRLNVKTNCKSQKVENNGESLTIFLKSKPIQNKANRELIGLIKKRLNISSNQIQIVSGSKSHDKLIRICFLENIEEQEVMRKLTF